jgi:hypothetical protein
MSSGTVCCDFLRTKLAEETNTNADLAQLTLIMTRSALTSLDFSVYDDTYRT